MFDFRPIASVNGSYRKLGKNMPHGVETIAVTAAGHQQMRERRICQTLNESYIIVVEAIILQWIRVLK